jgi:hypothetical protein
MKAPLLTSSALSQLQSSFTSFSSCGLRRGLGIRDDTDSNDGYSSKAAAVRKCSKVSGRAVAENIQCRCRPSLSRLATPSLHATTIYRVKRALPFLFPLPAFGSNGSVLAILQLFVSVLVSLPRSLNNRTTVVAVIVYLNPSNVNRQGNRVIDSDRTRTIPARAIANASCDHSGYILIYNQDSSYVDSEAFGRDSPQPVSRSGRRSITLLPALQIQCTSLAATRVRVGVVHLSLLPLAGCCIGWYDELELSRVLFGIGVQRSRYM